MFFLETIYFFSIKNNANKSLLNKTRFILIKHVLYKKYLLSFYFFTGEVKFVVKHKLSRFYTKHVLYFKNMFYILKTCFF